MASDKNHWLYSEKHFGGQKPGLALVKWLNDPPPTRPKWPNAPQPSPKFVEELLSHAKVVFQALAQYTSPHQLKIAKKKKELAPEFWDSHQRLNSILATFTYVPQIDLDEFPHGEQVSLMLSTEHSPIALYSVQVRLILQLIQQKAILKVRRCEECESWFFAQVSHRRFCKTSCQIKHFSGSEKFKAKRRKYMRGYYRLQR